MAFARNRMENRRNVNKFEVDCLVSKVLSAQAPTRTSRTSVFPVVCEVSLIPCRLAQGIEANQSFNNHYGNVRCTRDVFRATM